MNKDGKDKHALQTVTNKLTNLDKIFKMCKPCRSLLTYTFLFLCEIFTKVQNWTSNILTLLVSLKTNKRIASDRVHGYTSCHRPHPFLKCSS